MTAKEELKNISRELLGYVRFLNEDDLSAEATTGTKVMKAITETKAMKAATGTRAATGTKGTETMKATPASRTPEAAKKSDNKSNSKQRQALEEIFKKVSTCRKCSLGTSRIKPVFGVGDPNAGVMFVGEGPGYEEDHRGEPFIGRAGKLLDKMLAAIGLSRDNVYITNIVKCHAMINPSNPDARGNDRPPGQAEIATCRPYLDLQIAVIRPRCIVALGSVAAQVLLGTSVGISRLRGKWHDFGAGSPDLFSGSSGIADMGIKLLPVYHPAALLRNPNLKRDTWDDMKLLHTFLSQPKSEL